MVSIVGLVVLAATGCATGPSDEVTADDESSIVGGIDARHPAYDAVGALVIIAKDGSVTPFCSGTLVGPNVVLSAKHCHLVLPRDTKIGFGIGYDGFHPRRVVPIVRSEWERGRVTGAVMGLGADVALSYLAEAVTDIRPLEIGTLEASDVGTKLLAVGYGGQDAVLVDPSAAEPASDDPTRFFGTRKMVARTLRAIEGRYWSNIYSSLEEFIAAGGDKASWDEVRLLPSYDIVVGGVRDEGTVCGGDSGGPLLRAEGGVWKVYGVASGYRFQSTTKPHWKCYEEITVYSALGPEAKHLVEAARACGGVTQVGTCDANQATRCTRLEEGPPHIVRSDCGVVGHVCSVTPQEPTCAPACTGDADCDLLATGGKCDLLNGRCSWVPRCADEHEFACALCCFGQEADPFACIATCENARATASTEVIGSHEFSR